MMLSVVCRSPGEIATEKRPAPERGAGEVLLAIRRIGICGTDYHIYEGLHPFLAYPRVMGHELSATVIEAPPGSRLAPGEAVVVNPYLSCGLCHACLRGTPNCCMNIKVLGVHCDGGMCERISLPEENVIPAGKLSLDAAASVEFLAIGAHAVRRSGPIAGLRALVVGAGPIGLGAAIFAAIAGAEVTLMDRDVARLKLAQRVSKVERAVVADESATDRLAEITAGDGFDAVFDATGNRRSMEASFAHVAHGGSYTLVGLVRDDITFSDPEFHKREATLRASRNATLVDFQHVMQSMEAGLVPVEALLTHRTVLEDVPRDLPRWALEKVGLIKAMIELD